MDEKLSDLDLHCFQKMTYMLESHATPKSGEGVLWYFHTCLGSDHLGGGVKILTFNIFWGFRKRNIWGDILGGHHNIELVLWVISMYFRVFP